MSQRINSSYTAIAAASSLIVAVAASSSLATVALILGNEYQGQNATGAPAGNIRGPVTDGVNGRPDKDPIFNGFLASAGLTAADLIASDLYSSGKKAVWGKFAVNGEQAA